MPKFVFFVFCVSSPSCQINRSAAILLGAAVHRGQGVCVRDRLWVCGCWPEGADVCLRVLRCWAGSGYGLTVVELVMAMDGRRVGCGTLFFFSFSWRS